LKSGAVDRKTVARIVARGEEEGVLERHRLEMPAKTTGGLRQHDVLTAAGALDLEVLEKVRASGLRAAGSGWLREV
jgi:hypothetical protein